MAQDERTLNMDLPDAVVLAAKGGNADAIRDWLAAGGAPNAIRPNGNSLLACACMSARPSCASVVEILCEAGARDVGGARGGDGRCLGLAATMGALDTVRVLLRYGAPAGASLKSGTTALHQAVITNEWRRLVDPWSRARAKAAASIGHQGIVRLLLRHGAAVNALTATGRFTPLMGAAQCGGFVSLGVVRELLAGGADLDLVDTKGRNAEALARRSLSYDLYTGEGIPDTPFRFRRPGAVEAFLALLAEVRAAGSWKRYANEPRLQLVVLSKLAESGRAVATRGVATRLFAPRRRVQAMGSRALPDVLFWKILEFWRTDRDP